MYIRASLYCIILGHSDALMGVICTSSTEFGKKMKSLQLDLFAICSSYGSYHFCKDNVTLHLILLLVPLSQSSNLHKFKHFCALWSMKTLKFSPATTSCLLA